MFFGADKKGQAAAPFELFVAVIIMGFVMLVGSIVLTDMQNRVCLDSVEKEMVKFKLALEATANMRSTNSFSFSPEGTCFASKDAVLRLELEKNSKVCSSRCGYPSDQCYILLFSNPRIPGAFKQKCINLPQYISFLTEESCYDSTKAGAYITVDPLSETKTLPEGSYTVQNVSPAGDTFTKVCIWYKSRAG